MNKVWIITIFVYAHKINGINGEEIDITGSEYVQCSAIAEIAHNCKGFAKVEGDKITVRGGDGKNTDNAGNYGVTHFNFNAPKINEENFMVNAVISDGTLNNLANGGSGGAVGYIKTKSNYKYPLWRAFTAHVNSQYVGSILGGDVLPGESMKMPAIGDDDDLTTKIEFTLKALDGSGAGYTHTIDEYPEQYINDDEFARYYIRVCNKINCGVKNLGANYKIVSSSIDFTDINTNQTAKIRFGGSPTMQFVEPRIKITTVEPNISYRLGGPGASGHHSRYMVPVLGDRCEIDVSTGGIVLNPGVEYNLNNILDQFGKMSSGTYFVEGARSPLNTNTEITCFNGDVANGFHANVPGGNYNFKSLIGSLFVSEKADILNERRETKETENLFQKIGSSIVDFFKNWFSHISEDLTNIAKGGFGTGVPACEVVSNRENISAQVREFKGVSPNGMADVRAWPNGAGLTNNLEQARSFLSANNQEEQGSEPDDQDNQDNQDNQLGGCADIGGVSTTQDSDSTIYNFNGADWTNNALQNWQATQGGPGAVIITW